MFFLFDICHLKFEIYILSLSLFVFWRIANHVYTPASADYFTFSAHGLDACANLHNFIVLYT